jgi:hypothetical protein
MTSSAFRDLDEFLVDQPIELPIRGKNYRFPGSISARTGLLLQRMGAKADEARRAGQGPAELASAAMDAEVLDDETELDLRRELMGDTEAEMARDGLTTAHTGHVFRTLIVWHMAGEEAALAAWTALGNVQAPNREARRKASKASGTTSPARKRTAAASAGRSGRGSR